MNTVNLLKISAKMGMAALFACSSLGAKDANIPGPGGDLNSGWGIDTCLSCHTPLPEVEPFIARLREARLVYVRERNPGRLDDSENRERGRWSVMRKLAVAGYKVVGFVELGIGLHVSQAGDQLPEDLLAVYRAAREMSRKMGGDVSVWEMVGEPDSGFCHDLPDRVAALQKAMYLGIKDGAGGGDKSGGQARLFSKAPGVLMGALAGAPGPWLSRAARNGLYDYTDGVNFHFYGYADDLRGVIGAQEVFARRYASGRVLPLWITECGMNAIPEGRPHDPHARELQREFTLETARIARQKGVSVFMPFSLGGQDKDGFGMLESVSKPYPAWTTFARYTRQYALRSGRALAPPASVGRVVMQWLPDNLTCTPHKVSGTYWFDDDGASMKGALIAYNFSDHPVRGEVETRVSGGIQMKANPARKTVEIPAFGSVHLPVIFETGRSPYVRGEAEVSFRSTDTDSPSNLVFGLETRPSKKLLPQQTSIKGHRPEGHFAWIWWPERYRISSQGGPWLGVNGVKVGDGDAAVTGGPLDAAWRMQVMKRQADPRLPPMAVTKVNGLPDLPDAFVRLRTSEDGDLAADIRVDLVDKYGQRFSVSENFGRDWSDPDQDVTFLSYRDFQLYVFGRCTARPVFKPADIREIQLRFYPKALATPVFVRLDVVSPIKSAIR